MAQVNVSINGKNYSIACDEGQQYRVAALGRYADQRLRDLARAGGASSEPHLLVLTALLLADEVFDLRDNVASMEEQTQASRTALDNEASAAETISRLADRIAVLAERIETV